MSDTTSASAAGERLLSQDLLAEAMPAGGPTPGGLVARTVVVDPGEDDADSPVELGL